MRATPQTQREIVLRIDSIDRLFNESDADPFSDKEAAVLGKPALAHMVRRQMGRQERNRSDDLQLTIMVPPDQFTADLEQETIAAIQRYSTARIEDNRLSIHLSRVRGMIGLGINFCVALALMALAYVLLITVFANSSDAVQSIVIGFGGLFAWVSIWTPMERLLFDWVDPALENRILRKISAMKIAIVPEPPHVSR